MYPYKELCAKSSQDIFPSHLKWRHLHFSFRIHANLIHFLQRGHDVRNVLDASVAIVAVGSRLNPHWISNHVCTDASQGFGRLVLHNLEIWKVSVGYTVYFGLSEWDSNVQLLALLNITKEECIFSITWLHKKSPCDLCNKAWCSTWWQWAVARSALSAWADGYGRAILSHASPHARPLIFQCLEWNNEI